VRGATEDEQPVHLVQTAQLDLAQRAGLLQPSEALLHQPAAAQADRVAGVPCGSPVEVRAALGVVLRNMQGDVELERSLDEVLRVAGLVRAQRDAPFAASALLFEQDQRGLAFGVAIGRGHHRGGDQAVAVLHQRVAEIGQMRLLAIALHVQPRVRIGGRLMRLVRALLAVEVRPVAIVGCLKTAAWRRERDSNPRSPLGLSGFQDRLFQPLTHPSA
jgi:hypothetical protein